MSDDDDDGDKYDDMTTYIPQSYTNMEQSPWTIKSTEKKKQKDMLKR